MKTAIGVSVILFILIVPCRGQDVTTADPLKVSGQLSAFTEKYSFSGTGTAAHKPTTGRLQLNLNFSFFDALQIPLTGILATDQVAFRQNINQLAIHPRYKWVTVHAGTFAPQFSELTLGDATALGGGVDLTPGDFHFSVVGGRINKGIGATDVNMSYTRDLYGVQAGYGDIERTFVDLNIVRSMDLAASLPDTAQITPQDNLVASLRFQVKLLDNRITIANEVSGSAFTKNTRASESGDVHIGLFHSFFTARASTTSDWAMVNKIQYAEDTWSADLKTTYIRPGYISFGYSQLQADQFEYTVGGRIRLLENRLFLNSNVGQRRDNLASDKESATKRLIFNFNSSWQVVPFFGWDFVYGTNDVNIKNSNDTTTISNINNVVSLVPRFMFATGELQHLVVLNGTYQNSDNTTNKNLQLVNSKTTSGLVSYTLTFPSPLSLNLSVLYTAATMDTVQSKIFNITPTVNYSFLDNKLTTSLGVQFGSVTSSGQGTDKELFPQLSVSYTIVPRNTLNFSITHRAYTYGDPLVGGNFKESIATLRYTLSF